MKHSNTVKHCGTQSGRPPEALISTIAWFAIWLAFAWPWLFGNVTIPWDGKAHFAPQVQFMAASFARGESPWWTPHIFAGHPQIADPQSMLFSPPFVVLALIDGSPGPWAIDAVVLIMLLLAGVGILAYTRDLGWHWAGGLVAAIGFALGAAMAWRLQHFGQVLSLAYLPFALLFLRRSIQRGSIFYGALAGLLAAFIVLGRDQVGLLCVYLLAGYGLALLLDGQPILHRLRGALLPLVTGAIVAALLVTIPILLTISLAEQSNRPSISYLDAAAGSLHPALLITALAPHLFGAAGEMRDYWGPPSFYWENTGLYLAQNMGVIYIGALSLLAIVIGALRGFLGHRDIRFFATAWLMTLLYALGWYTPAFLAMYEVVPGVAYYRRPADAVFLLGALAALLAGYVVHRLLQDTPDAAWQSRWFLAAAVGVIAILFAIATGFALILGRFEAAQTPLVLAIFWITLAASALGAALWLAPIRPILAGSLLVGVLAADVTINNGPNGASALPRQALDMLEPDARNEVIASVKKRVEAASDATHRPRVEMIGLGYHWPNTALTHNLHSTLGANPVRLNHYVEATGAGDTAAEGRQRAFPPLFPSYRSSLANLLGLRFIVTAAPIETIDTKIGSTSFSQVDRIGRFRIYENDGALPRILFATDARATDFAKILETGRWPGIDFRQTVLLKQAPDNVAVSRPGSVRIRTYQNTAITLDVESPDGGWVVLNDVWHPWWRGTINDHPAPILKANVIFRAIKVPPGHHTVRFTFQPLSGLWAQLISPSYPRHSKMSAPD